MEEQIVIRKFEQRSRANSMIINGGIPLCGTVPVSGYKHALTLLISAGIISRSRKIEIHNVPDISETIVLLNILQQLGGEATFKDHTLTFNSANIKNRAIPGYLSRQIHGSVYIIPAMLARFGEVYFEGSGGDRIGDPSKDGSRTIDHIISVLKRFGAQFKTNASGVHGICGKLKGQIIDINDYAEHKETGSGPFVSGATKTALLAAIVADGTTVIKNPWDKDATIELISFLENCGCSIRIYDGYWEIDGNIKTSRLSHNLISDPTEIITYIACSTYLRNPITITNVTDNLIRRALEPELKVLERMDINLRWADGRLYVDPSIDIKPVDVRATSRGLNTDSHPFFTLMLTTASGPSSVTDYVWRYRFAYVDHLKRLGADLHRMDRTVKINPRVPYIRGCMVRAADTRAGAVAVLAALSINGKTSITETYHIDRGYEHLGEKLRGLGADITVNRGSVFSY